MAAWESEGSFRERVARDERITKFLDPAALHAPSTLTGSFIDPTPSSAAFLVRRGTSCATAGILCLTALCPRSEDCFPFL